MFIPIIAHAQLEERIREQLSLIRTEKSGTNEFGEFWLTVQSLQNAILAQTVQAGCHLMLPYVPLTQFAHTLARTGLAGCHSRYAMLRFVTIDSLLTL
jgi:hypothetical protein